MLMPVLSGLVVSVDAFFIGMSLGLQKRCKFLYLVIINTFLFVLCMLGFLLAGQLYALIPFDTDLVVGFAFIALGLWWILHYVLSVYIKCRRGRMDEDKSSLKTISLVGLVMSVEAMLITMGLTFLFLPGAVPLIPLTVALAHFGYAALSFHLARTRYVKRIPAGISHVISGFALIAYGLMALFVELGM